MATTAVVGFGTGALALTPAVGAGDPAQPQIVSQVADIADAGLAKLKSTDDSAFAESLRNAREGSHTGVLAWAFGT